jgi:primosomal protein N' (replication factor Y)
LRCHHCGAVQNLITDCPSCSATDLTTYGAGTQQIEDKLQSYFPDVTILRVDKDSTQRVGSFEKIVNEIQQGGAKILIGTQMLAKGHDFHDVTLVGVLDADQGLFSADFRATESLAQLITQVTGRAGRGKKPGTVYIQTSQVDHPFWKDLLQHDYFTTAAKLLQERAAIAMPPYGSLCIIRARAKDKEISMQFLMDVAEILRQSQSQEVLILGPVPAIMEKRAGYFRAQLLLATQNRKRLHQLLDYHIETISQLKRIKNLKWSIDIDPIDLF